MKKLRNMDVYKTAVSDIKYVAMVHEVQWALNRWIASKNSDVAPGVLIGSLAMSFYAAPRTTMDIDLLFLSKKDIPKTVKGFQKQGPSAFLEIKNNIVVDVKTPEAFNGLVPPEIAQKIFHTAINHGGILVASREGMIALKLCGAEIARRKFQYLGDVQRLMEEPLDVSTHDWDLANPPWSMHQDVSMHDWGLTEKQLSEVEKIRKACEEYNKLLKNRKITD